MTKNYSKPVKVKVQKVTSNKHHDITIHIVNKNDEKIHPSSELLKGIIYFVFIALDVFCGLVSLCVWSILYFANTNVICRAATIGNGILILSQVIILFIYYHNPSQKMLVKVLAAEIGVPIFISFLYLFIISIKDCSQNAINTAVYFCMMNFFSFLLCVFITVSNDILEENDKNYIVGYFSALTAFSALIVSLVALLK